MNVKQRCIPCIIKIIEEYNKWFANVAKDLYQTMQGIEHLSVDTVMELWLDKWADQQGDLQQQKRSL